jgi:hypothetical protein
MIMRSHLWYLCWSLSGIFARQDREEIAVGKWFSVIYKIDFNSLEDRYGVWLIFESYNS